MKKQLLVLLGAFALVFAMTTRTYAQTPASVTWPLTSNQQATTVGNVDADSAMGHVLVVRNYTSAAMGGPLGANQARWWMGFVAGSTSTGANWPASTGQENNLYIDFVVKPKAGYDLMVDSIKGSFGGGGTNNMRANVYYGGTDTSLTSLTQLNTAIYMLKQASYYTSGGAADTNVAYYVGLKISSGQKFRFRIYPWYQSSTVSNSKYLYTQNVIITGTTTVATGVENESAIPTDLALDQNYPNPFNPSTNIGFSLNQSGNVKLVVYNLIGQEVATLMNGFLPAGKHNFKFDATNLPTGVYIYRLVTANQSLIKKMMLIK